MFASFWYSELFLILFYCYTLFSLIICFYVICSASAAHAVLFLVLLFILSSFLFIFLGAEYVGLIFIIVYVGAIAILFLFIIMLLDLRNLIFQRFTFLQSIIFSWSVMLTSDFLLYILNLTQLPFFSLPLVPVSGLIDINGDTKSLADNLLYLSPEFFNIYGLYVLGCGFILAFVMVGVVLMLGKSNSFITERRHFRNKVNVSAMAVIKEKVSRYGL